MALPRADFSNIRPSDGGAVPQIPKVQPRDNSDLEVIQQGLTAGMKLAAQYQEQADRTKAEEVYLQKEAEIASLRNQYTSTRYSGAVEGYAKYKEGVDKITATGEGELRGRQVRMYKDKMNQLRSNLDQEATKHVFIQQKAQESLNRDRDVHNSTQMALLNPVDDTWDEKVQQALDAKVRHTLTSQGVDPDSEEGKKIYEMDLAERYSKYVGEKASYLAQDDGVKAFEYYEKNKEFMTSSDRMQIEPRLVEKRDQSAAEQQADRLYLAYPDSEGKAYEMANRIPRKEVRDRVIRELNTRFTIKDRIKQENQIDIQAKAIDMIRDGASPEQLNQFIASIPEDIAMKRGGSDIRDSISKYYSDFRMGKKRVSDGTTHNGLVAMAMKNPAKFLDTDPMSDYGDKLTFDELKSIKSLQQKMIKDEGAVLKSIRQAGTEFDSVAMRIAREEGFRESDLPKVVSQLKTAFSSAYQNYVMTSADEVGGRFVDPSKSEGRQRNLQFFENNFRNYIKGVTGGRKGRALKGLKERLEPVPMTMDQAVTSQSTQNFVMAPEPSRSSPTPRQVPKAIEDFYREDLRKKGKLTPENLNRVLDAYNKRFQGQ